MALLPSLRLFCGLSLATWLAACASPKAVSVSFADSGKAEQRLELSFGTLSGSTSSIVEDRWLMMASYRMEPSRDGGSHSVLNSQNVYLLPEEVSRKFWGKVDRWSIPWWTADDLHTGCGGRSVTYRRGAKTVKLDSTSQILKPPLPERAKYDALEREIYALKDKGQPQPLTSLATRWVQPTDAHSPTKN